MGADPDLRRRHRDPVPVRSDAHEGADRARHARTTRTAPSGPSSRWSSFVGLGVADLRRVAARTTAGRAERAGSDRRRGQRAVHATYVLPFEAVSFLLLAALIGAIVLARRDEGS